MFKDYEKYSLDDFLKDEFFIKWIKTPNEESKYFWQNWIKRHPEKVAIILKAKDIVESLEYESSMIPSEQDYIEVLERIHKSSYFKVNRTKYTRLAASIAFFLIVSLGVSILYFDNLVLTNNNENHTSTISEKEVEYVVKEAAAGSRLSLTLMDGTKVKLNAESSLRIPKSFSEHHRTVHLTGEAFFDVEKDTLRPFIIHSGGVKTVVLGTSFNINAYPEEPWVNIAVVSGKVAVEQNENLERILLTQNDVLLAHRTQEKQVIKRNVELTSYLLWQEGILIYHEASFKEITKDLERWYGVKFIIEDELSINGKYSGQFDNKTLENVLEGLSFILEFQYVIEDNKVYIKK